MTKTLALILPLLALSCCAPTHGSRAPGAFVPQSAVPEGKPVAAAAAGVRQAAAAVDLSAAGIEARAAVLARETKTLRAALGELSSKADVLRKQAAVSVEEKADLWARLTDITQRSITLEDEATAAVKALDEQKALRALATARIDQLEIDARNRDGEVGKLRLQLDDEKRGHEAAVRLATANDMAADDWQLQAGKWEAKASDYKGQRKVFGWASAIAILLCIAIVYFSGSNPLSALKLFGR